MSVVVTLPTTGYVTLMTVTPPPGSNEEPDVSETFHGKAWNNDTTAIALQRAEVARLRDVARRNRCHYRVTLVHRSQAGQRVLYAWDSADK